MPLAVSCLDDVCRKLPSLSPLLNLAIGKSGFPYSTCSLVYEGRSLRFDESVFV